MKNAILIFAFLLCHQAIAQEAEWQWQNPKPTGCTLNSVFFINEKVGWIAGQYNTLMKSTDGGLSWVSQKKGISGNWRSIFFLDSLKGWVIGGNNTIIKTNDGGKNWLTVQKATRKFLRRVWFTDAQTGWAIGNYETILKSTDGGSNWKSQRKPGYISLFDCHFLNQKMGWIVGDNGLILKTTNGGTTWQKQITGIKNRLNEVYFSDSLNGEAVCWSGDFKLKTSDGGKNWDSLAISLNKTQEWYYTIDLKNRIRISENNLCKRNENDGFWYCSLIHNYHFIENMHFIDTLYGWAVGEKGYILKSSDGGSSWQQLTKESEFQLNDICFTTSFKGWAVGDESKMLKTTNKGRTWEVQDSLPGYVDFKDIYFTDSLTGWAVGHGNGVYITKNGGKKWDFYVDTSRYLLINSVHFATKHLGWMVGESGQILNSTDGGESWNVQVIERNWNLYSVYFFDSLTGFAIGDQIGTRLEGLILKTTNGGKNWYSPQIPNFEGFRDSYRQIQFVDDKTGWILTDRGNVAKTTDKGNSWHWLYVDGEDWDWDYIFENVYFLNSSLGYAKRGDTFYFTKDGGMNWNSVEDVFPTDFSYKSKYTLYFKDSLNGWVVGSNGTILHTSSGGGRISIKNVSDSDYSPKILLYPNPADQFIEIESPWPIQSITLSDAYGHNIFQIPVLKEEYSTSGYSAVLDISSLPRGFYFVKIFANYGDKITLRFVKE